VSERKKLRHGGNYREHRVAAYPPVGDGLDAVAKILRALLKGETPPQDALDWLAKCESVKTRIKKPAEG
jgi:hypothetical protein